MTRILRYLGLWDGEGSPKFLSWFPVIGVIGVVLWQMHLNLLLTPTSTTGGDTGAHFMMPAYFNSIFPHLTGWDPSWYDGYPIYTFYFVLPDSLVALFSHVLTYDIAFKWGTVLGSILLPIFVRLAAKRFGLREPIPGALAAATLPFLFENSFEIYGGNLFSTLAGEYAYSLSLALAVLFIGLFASGLKTGRRRGWAAVVLGLCILAHIVPAMFAIGVAGLLTLFELLPGRFRVDDNVLRPITVRAAPRTRPVVPMLWWAASTVVLGVSLAAWWLVPFHADLPWSTAMGYTNVSTYRTLFLPSADVWALLVGAVAVVMAFIRRSRFGVLLVLAGAASAIGVVFDPQGSLYNVRLLPFWFLCLYLLDGWLLGLALGAVARWWRRDRVSRWVARLRTSPELAGRRPTFGTIPAGALVGPGIALAVVLLIVIPPFIPKSTGFLKNLGITPSPAEVSSWASWNYDGYEGKADYHEYQAINTSMTAVGRTHGCGRAMWEYNSNQDRFGTPEALMLLPYWTHGCIDSMEGLLFESSTTTPFHFLNQAEMSTAPSDPMVGLPYGPLEVTLGVKHLKLLGVRYFMAFSPDVVAQANADRTLQEITKFGPEKTTYNGAKLSTTWVIYLVKHSGLVQPLSEQPAVLTGVGPSQHTWLGSTGPTGSTDNGPSVAWYLKPERWNVELAATGPAGWQRVSGSAVTKSLSSAHVSNPVRKVPVKPTRVSDVSAGNEQISFKVTTLGTPVLVKESWFPNWHAEGALGPYRVTPNLMVVVPTSHTVTLVYGSTPADHEGDALTVLGVLLLLVPFLVRRLRRVG